MFGKKKSVAGLDIGSSSIKMVELEGKLNNLNLVSLGFENLPSDTIIDGQIMELNVVSDVIQSVCSNHQVNATNVVTGVSGHPTLDEAAALENGPHEGRRLKPVGVRELQEMAGHGLVHHQVAHHVVVILAEKGVASRRGPVGRRGFDQT